MVERFGGSAVRRPGGQSGQWHRQVLVCRR